MICRLNTWWYSAIDQFSKFAEVSYQNRKKTYIISTVFIWKTSLINFLTTPRSALGYWRRQSLNHSMLITANFPIQFEDAESQSLSKCIGGMTRTFNSEIDVLFNCSRLPKAFENRPNKICGKQPFKRFVLKQTISHQFF